MLRRIALLAALCGLAVPAVAGAATVTRDADGTLRYTAAPGAATNNVDVQDADPGTVLYTSGGDPMTSWPDDCTSDYDGEVVTCPPAPAVYVSLGDGNDKGTATSDLSVPLTFDGGAGSDVLNGTDRADVLLGGAGDDQIDGRGGADTLSGGDGSDEISGGADSDHLDGGAGDDILHPDDYEDASADVVDGGPGVDLITEDYVSRFTDVHPLLALTLAGGADDGRPGEGDDLENVEKVDLSVGGTFVGSAADDTIKLRQVGDDSSIDGGAGNDTLSAGDGADHIDGGPGADRIDGGYGDDTIVGGPGQDIISADSATGDCGPLWCKYPYGNDHVDVRDGEVDSVSCGFGDDTVLADPVDKVDSDCEHVVISGGGGGGGSAGGVTLRLVGHPRLAKALKSGLRVRLTSAKAGRIALVAKRGGLVVARGGATVSAGAPVTVTLRFTAAGKRALRHASRAALVISGAGARGSIRLVR